MMIKVREPAVAGMFYPAEPASLRAAVQHYLAETDSDGPPPKAVIAPHAGYVYSGPIAASAYARLRAAKATITRVILLGPAHRVAFTGLAASSAEQFNTPLGPVRVDQSAIGKISHLSQVHVLDEAHAQEHSLEVQLPFLLQVLDDFALAPLVVGDASAQDVAEVLEALWGGDETLIVISSDLSHYRDYNTARRMDSATSRAIEELRPERIHFEDACGRNPINGLLVAAAHHGLHAQTLDLRNSGDTAGPRDRVVGYGAYAFT